MKVLRKSYLPAFPWWCPGGGKNKPQLLPDLCAERLQHLICRCNKSHQQSPGRQVNVQHVPSEQHVKEHSPYTGCAWSSLKHCHGTQHSKHREGALAAPRPPELRVLRQRSQTAGPHVVLCTVVGLDGPQRSLPTWDILWFHDPCYLGETLQGAPVVLKLTQGISKYHFYKTRFFLQCFKTCALPSTLRTTENTCAVRWEMCSLRNQPRNAVQHYYLVILYENSTSITLSISNSQVGDNKISKLRYLSHIPNTNCPRLSAGIRFCCFALP